MIGRPLTLFRIFGFAIRVDASWTILALLIAFQWYQVIHLRHAALPPLPAWALAAAGTVGLFASIVFHELSHSLVARRRGVAIRGITLFIFGGVAEMEEEPRDARSEFWIAVVGPLSSFLLGGLLTVAGLIGGVAGWPAPVVTLLISLAGLNVTLAIFNLIPAFPLDGGRILRAFLWGRRGNLRSATRVASRIGVGFGTLLMILGPARLLIEWAASGTMSNPVGAVWMVLIGMFLRAAAATPYRQLVTRQALEGEPVRRFMVADPVVVPRHVPVQELVDDYVYRHHFKMFPVVDGGRLLGCVTIERVKALPPDEWPRRTVGEITEPCGPDNTIGPDEDAVTAITRMTRRGATRLMVVEGDQLLGVLTLRDLLAFLSLKLELGDK